MLAHSEMISHKNKLGLKGVFQSHIPNSLQLIQTAPFSL